MNWNNEKAIVTGGNGFLGKRIVNFLIQKNCSSIAAFCRKPSPELREMDINVINGDIRDLSSLKSAFSHRTIIFHTAAKAEVWGEKEEFFKTNTIGTENVLRACRINEIPALIYTSSPSVAYPCGKNIEKINEDTPYPEKYLSFYPESKATAEKIVLLQKEVPAVSLRPHLIWGPGDPHLLPRIIEQARKGKLMRIGDGNNMVDLTFVENAAYAHILAAEELRNSHKCQGKAYFISDGIPVNLWNWINFFLNELGVQKIKKSVSYKTAFAMGLVFEKIYSVLNLRGEPPMTRFIASQLAHSHYFDISAAKHDFGYSPIVGEDEAIRKTVESFRMSSC